MKGWIKLHRRLVSSDIFQNEKLLKVFIYCLLKATHKEQSILVGLQTVDLKQGQFVFGRSRAASELNMKESTVWKYIKFLEKVKSISLKSNNKFTIITVENWADYQSLDDDEEQQSNNKVTSKKQQNNTNKNVKNDKNDKEEKNKKNNSRKQVFDESSIHYQLSLRLFEKIKENNPDHKEPNLQTWAEHIRLMMEQDNRTEEQIKYLIDWSQNNLFWRTNILSTKKLREQYDRLVAEIKAEREKPQRRTSKPIRQEYMPDFMKEREQGSTQVPETPDQDFEEKKRLFQERLKKNAT